MKQKPSLDYFVLFSNIMIMQHFLLLAYFCALMLGMWAAVSAFQFYKVHQYPFLRYLGVYIVFINSALFLYFITTYLSLNFPGSQFMEENSVYFALILVGSIIFWTGCVRSYISLFLEFKKIRINGFLRNTLNFVLGAIGIVLVIGMTTFFLTRSIIVLHWLYMSVFGLVGLVFFSGTILLLRGKGPYKSFAFLSLIGYLLFFTAPLFTGTLKIYMVSSAIIGLNLLPLLWLKHFFLQHYVSFSEENGIKFLDLIKKQYQISKRETEVMELLLQGKSNTEIERALFISYNTVKNHIYNIYQKLGVKSRGQLIRFVIERLKTE